MHSWPHTSSILSLKMRQMVLTHLHARRGESVSFQKTSHVGTVCVYVCTAEGAYVHVCANVHVSTYA